MKFAMLTSILGLVVVAAISGISGKVSSFSAKDQGCGGLLEGANGEFEYIPTPADGDQAVNCVWLVQSHGATQIEITLNELLPTTGNGSTVIVFPADSPGEAHESPIMLHEQAVGSTVALSGSIAAIILPQPKSSLSFTWDSTFPSHLVEKQGSTLSAPKPKSTTKTETATIASTTASTGVPQSIYFATFAHGISAFSLETKQVRQIVDSYDNLVGITHDSISNKLYWCETYGTIYRSKIEEIEVEAVISINDYSLMYDLAFDRITGNVYVATIGGYILACRDGAPTLGFSCFVVLNDLGRASAITLDETEGLMYWTNDPAGSIHKGGMDGSSPVTIVTGLGYPQGLTIDIPSRRLYWTELNGDKIQSSDLDGRDIQLLIQLPTGSQPCGITILDERIYWGNYGDYKLQSATVDGRDLQTLYTERNSIRQIVAVPASAPPTNRTNHCAGRTCSTICVLAPTSHSCLPSMIPQI